jgi:hypothetical protein
MPNHQNLRFDVTEPDWKLVAFALCIKYGTREGTALVGDGTLAWVKKFAEMEVIRKGDTLTLRWESPPLTLNGPKE